MQRLAALEAIYGFYEQFTANLPVACEPGCSTCCSVNVTVTSLEMEFLRLHPLTNDSAVLEEIKTAQKRPHFIPTLTTNQLAKACLAREEPPEETGTHAPGNCPLLGSDGLCRVYTHRPFACRAMLSRTRCRTGGNAEIAPFIYSINLTLCQLIEHLDSQGRSGNLLDMFFTDNKQSTANKEFPGYVVAPDEQIKHQRFLDKLVSCPVGGGKVADYFPDQSFTRE